MHYELWEFQSRSLVNTYEAKDEALAMVRLLLASGWNPDDLALGCELQDDSQSGQLPPVLKGAELVARALAAGLDQAPISGRTSDASP